MSEATNAQAMLEKAAEAADFMRLFGTPSRLMLLCHIAVKECSVGEIQEALDFRQPALSQQLAELRQAGLVRTRRESRQVFYSIADERVAVVMDMLIGMFCPAEAGVRHDTAASSPLPRDPSPAEAQTQASPARCAYAPAGGPFGEMAAWARLEGAKT